jgi:hypothetical protein
MKLSHVALLLVTGAGLFTAGCASHPYYAAAPPPPPYGNTPPLIARADHEGFRTGSEDGVRDRVNGFGYHPRNDRRYHDTPGYDPSMGPFGPYRDAFRKAYLRGYDQGFRRP